MTFQSIIWQNLRYNANKYLSYLFVNSFVVAALFLYGSLLFNGNLTQNTDVKVANLYIYIAAVAIILFCVVFVTYTGIYFVKARGREFGVYLTLGMSNRDLMKMVQLETAAIVFGSVICGLLGGLALSGAFYALLAKILSLSMAIYSITWKCFALTLGVFVLVMLFNMIFTARFLKKLSIAQITKSQNTRGKDNSRPVLGILGILMFIFSMWFFHALLNGYTFLRDASRNYGEIMLILTMVLMLSSMYVAIAFLTKGVQWSLKLFPAAYNRCILTISDLSHKFFTYKTTLYMVSVLIIFSIFFMGLGMGAFSPAITEKKVEEALPYDFMIENIGSINNISEDEIQRIVAENGGEIDEFHTLPFLIDMNYRNLPEFFLNYRVDSMLISESAFNALTGENLNLAPDNMLLVYTDEKSSKRPMDFDSVITVEPWREGIVRGDDFRSKEPNEPNMNTFINELDIPYLTYTKENTKVKYLPFINKYGDFEFANRVVNVVDDGIYAELSRDAQINKLYLFNLKSGNGAGIYEGLLNALRTKNGNVELWKNGAAAFGVKDDAESLRPIYRAERKDTALKICGFLLFAMMFLGLLFLLSSSVVLYYKISADKNEEKEKAALLQKIGVTSHEYRRELSLRFGILFFAPLIFGGIFGLFLIYEVISVSMAAYSDYLIGRMLFVYGAFTVWNLMIYFLLKRKIV
jgi:hypothetical protein